MLRGLLALLYIRDKHRTGLTTEHLEAYMHLRLNGQKDLAAFSALKYAKSWFAKGKLLTDSVIQSHLTEENPERSSSTKPKEPPKMHKACRGCRG